MKYVDFYDSPVGKIFLTAEFDVLTSLMFVGDEIKPKPAPVLDETKRWLDIYFAGKMPDFTPLIYQNTTPFRVSVWERIRKIPYGETMTYGALAKIFNTSAQAIGNAAANNKISIIIPCHRVIGAGNALTGYSGGLERKMRLLDLEVFYRRLFR